MRASLVFFETHMFLFKWFCFGKGLTLEISPLELFMVANLCYQPSWQYWITLFYLTQDNQILEIKGSKVTISCNKGNVFHHFVCCVDIQENLKEIEDKYRKAMVSNAQLDNEKQALLYQVDCLKDRYLCMVEIVVHVQE